MELQELEALRPEIEQKEKEREAQWKAKKERINLLLRACRAGLIAAPAPSRKPWWMFPEVVCPKCGGRLAGDYNYDLPERVFLYRCRREGCGYEYAR